MHEFPRKPPGNLLSRAHRLHGFPGTVWEIPGKHNFEPEVGFSDVILVCCGWMKKTTESIEGRAVYLTPKIPLTDTVPLITQCVITFLNPRVVNCE